MNDCVFCNIVSGAIPSSKVYEDDDVLVFEDLNPQAPTHVLIIPKVHISTINDLTEAHAETVGRLFIAAKKVAADQNFADEGYRVVMNCNDYGGQTVYHIHLHLLGGRPMSWPPG